MTRIPLNTISSFLGAGKKGPDPVRPAGMTFAEFAASYDRNDPRLKEMFRHPCGECQACCEVVGVTELGKPYYTRCQYQCGSGCQIYHSRPQSCADFSCVWRLCETAPPEWRPDRLGAIVGLFDDPNPVDVSRWVDVMEVIPETVVKKDGGLGMPFGISSLVAHMLLMLHETVEKACGVRIFPAGLPIPTSYEPRPPYTGVGDSMVRNFRVLKEEGGKQLLLYVGPVPRKQTGYRGEATITIPITTVKE